MSDISKEIEEGNYQPVCEGKAEILFPNTNEVFYNPVQEFNRDISCAVLNVFSKEHFSKKLSSAPNNVPNDAIESKWNSLLEGTVCDDGIKIMEGLSATGLRSIRYAKEVKGVQKIIANDFDQGAVNMIKLNTSHNSMNHLVQPNFGDAGMVLMEAHANKNWFEVVDLDPYGSPAHFIDPAMRAVRNGGLLMVTATDAGVLCGNGGDTCYSKYGSVSLRIPCCHEFALRVLLQCLSSAAARYSRYIEPLLCMSVDFYFRLFVRVHTGQMHAKCSVSKSSLIYQCTGCSAFHLQPLGVSRVEGNNAKFNLSSGPPVSPRCEDCGSRFHMAGPIWNGSIHDKEFVGRLIAFAQSDPKRYKTNERILGMLSVIQEELDDVPLYYVLDQVCKMFHLATPSQLGFRSAILNAGYRVSYSHCHKNSVKTDAPPNVLMDIIRCWQKLNPLSKKWTDKDGYIKRFFEKEPTLQTNFTERIDAKPSSKLSGLVRFQQNPEPNWGPKSRAKRDKKQTEVEESDGKRMKMNTSAGGSDSN